MKNATPTIRTKHFSQDKSWHTATKKEEKHFSSFQHEYGCNFIEFVSTWFSYPEWQALLRQKKRKTNHRYFCQVSIIVENKIQISLKSFFTAGNIPSSGCPCTIKEAPIISLCSRDEELKLRQALKLISQYSPTSNFEEMLMILSVWSIFPVENTHYCYFIFPSGVN